MAKTTATAVGGDSIHTRTTADATESGVAVIGEDGSDNVVGPHPSFGANGRALPVAGMSYPTQSGTITTATSTVTLSNIGAAGNVSLYIWGTYAGVNITFEISPDNTNWFPVAATREDSGGSETTSGVLPANTSRAWVMGAPGFSYVRMRATAWTSGTANVALVAGTYPFEPLVSVGAQRKLSTYSATFRTTTAGQHSLVPAASTTRKQVATIHHAATATKTVKLRRVQVFVHSVAAASNFVFDLVRITSAPATGNPAITPAITDNADAAAEATCLALPTTAGTETGGVHSFLQFGLGITSATASTVNPPQIIPWQDLLQVSPRDDETKLPTIRAGVLEGWAVTVEASASGNIACGVLIEFTEE